MSFTARDWIQLYESTKRQIISRRQSGQKFSQSEIKNITDNVRTLEGQLKIMSTSMMEYEMLIKCHNIL